MKYIPIVAIGLAIWGILTFDWFKIGFGVVLFFGSFLIDLFKKKGAVKDEKVFSVYKTISKLVGIIRRNIEVSGIEIGSPKAKLAQGLFFLGMIDAASQAAKMSDEQFLDLYKVVFTDLDYEYDHDYQSKLLLFHQSLNEKHSAFPAIMKGAGIFIKFMKGDTNAPMAGDIKIKELIEDKSFPSSVEAL